jgi:outer membrane protein, heavy metal efflux system
VVQRPRATRVAFLVWASAALAALPVSALAQTRAGPGLDDVLAIALRQNPDILAARLRADSAHGEQRIARAIPNPVLNSAPNQPWQYTVTLPLDVTPLRFLRTRAAGRGLEAARADAQDVARQVTFAVRQAFYDVLLTEQQRRLAGEGRKIFRQLLEADSVRLRSGDVPQRDVTKAELEYARAEANLLRADAQVHNARLALQLLIGVTAPDTAFTVTGDLAYRPVTISVDSLSTLAASLRPDVRAAQERVAQSEALSKLAATLWIPLPAVTFAHSNGPFASGDLFSNGTANAIGFGFTLPFLYWNGGERERSRAGLEQAEIAMRRVQAQVATEVATALDAYRSARGLAERYEGGLLAKADTVLETARYAYRTGATSLIDLLDAIRTYADTRADYNIAVHEYWVSVYALDRAVGRDIIP